MSPHAAIEKRLVRAKKILADAPGLFDVSTLDDVADRLPGVQRALYLLFNEGYHGASTRSAVRSELCREAMHLAAALLQDGRTATPGSHALAALMCLHAARLPARRDSSGELLPLSEQDRGLWDQELIAEGLQLLSLASKGASLSEYHLEAAIASVHAAALSVASTDWTKIVSLYDQLLAIRLSPLIALNRAIAIAQATGRNKDLRRSPSSKEATACPHTHFTLQPSANWSCSLAATVPPTAISKRQSRWRVTSRNAAS